MGGPWQYDESRVEEEVQEENAIDKVGLYWWPIWKVEREGGYFRVTFVERASKWDKMRTDEVLALVGRTGWRVLVVNGIANRDVALG